MDLICPDWQKKKQVTEQDFGHGENGDTQHSFILSDDEHDPVILPFGHKKEVSSIVRNFKCSTFVG